MASSLQDYLKRYTEPVKAEKKKNKKKRKKTNMTPGITIVDDDPVWQKDVKEDFDEDEEDDAPLLIKDDEVKRMQKLEALQMHRPYISIAEDGSGWTEVNRESHVSELKMNNSMQKESLFKVRGQDMAEHCPTIDGWSHSQQGHSSDSPTRKVSHDSPDLSPPRKARHVSPDLSPPRKRRDEHAALSPSRKAGFIGTESPPRKVRHDSPDLSPPRKIRHDSPDLSPPRKTRQDSPDLSPPRKIRLEPSDSCLRKRRADQAHLCPSRMQASFSKLKRDDTPNLSPSRKVQPQRRELSPMREVSPTRSTLPSQRKMTSDVELPKKHDKREDGLAMGLHRKGKSPEVFNSNQQTAARRLLEVDATMSGRNANTVYRDKFGKRVELDELVKTQLADKPAKDKPLEWGKGLAQKRDAEARLAELEAESAKPFARTRDDPELDKYLREQVRWGDPMAHLVKKNSADLLLEDLGASRAMKDSGFIVPQEIPKHSWLKRGIVPPPNRYGIKPGRHWDGVDRSNGFEKEMYKRQNERKADEVEAYLWSVADM